MTFQPFPLVFANSVQLAGKRVAYIACGLVLLLFTIGTALAPNMPVFVALRLLSGLQGTYFHVAGQTIIARYFAPVSIALRMLATVLIAVALTRDGNGLLPGGYCSRTSFR